MGRYLHRRVYKKPAGNEKRIEVSQTEMREVDVAPRISVNEMLGNLKLALERDESISPIDKKKLLGYVSKIESVLNQEERTIKNDTDE